MLVLAAGPRIDGLFAGLAALGLLIGIVGHVVRSRTMVVTGIVIVGVVMNYFVFFYRHP